MTMQSPIVRSRIFREVQTAVILAIVCVAGLPSSTRSDDEEKTASSERVLLRANENGSYDFDAKRISGTIEPQGEYFGVTKLADPTSGRPVIDPRYAALNLFKLMGANQYMGEPRGTNRTVIMTPTAVEITWPPTEQHLAEITARYGVNEPGSVDLTIDVRSSGVYPDYEILVSSYFDSELKILPFSPIPRKPSPSC